VARGRAAGVGGAAAAARLAVGAPAALEESAGQSHAVKPEVLAAALEEAAFGRQGAGSPAAEVSGCAS
jgi:hypothetical protein